MARAGNTHGWGEELRATLVLAWPLIIAQVASILLFTTDVVMMGWLGPTHLAAGTLATAILHPVFLGGIGVVSATAPMIAQAIGARQGKMVRRTIRQGFWVAFALTLVITPILFNAEPLFLLLGQNPEVAAMAQVYLYFAAGVALPGLLARVLHSLMQAKGSTGIILMITVAGIFVNALGNYLLMFGNFGFPRLELIGAGISTTVVNVIMYMAALMYVLLHKRYKRYYILVRLWKPDWARFREIFSIGIPIGLTLMSEVGLFGVAVVLMGWLGINEVAAHAVAVQCAAITFMVPLGLSTATTVRVGLAVGAGNANGVKKAGWTSMGLALVFMSMTCALFLLAPELLVGLFLDASTPANQVSFSLAVTYLGVAALFQLVDGAQVVMAAALRGMSDTRTPMILAVIGYWIVGLNIAYFFGFIQGYGGVGIWFGLASGLAFVAVVLTVRFAMRGPFKLMHKAQVGMRAR